jgi:flagellar motor switch protein FliN/FliY
MTTETSTETQVENRSEVETALVARAGDDNTGHSRIMKIPVKVQVVLGNMRMSVEELMKLTPGKQVDMNAQLDDLVELVANGRVMARGEIVVIDEQTSRLGMLVKELTDGSGLEKT